MRKLLIILFIVQKKKKASGFNSYRLNPYNPLSYITIPIIFIVGIIMFGVVGIKEEMDFERNPFKWT